jgi:curved DNA-binding protein CbpA
MIYFQNIHTVGEAKTLYRQLAKQYHPDLHGHETTQAMQDINAEYHSLLESLDGSTSKGSDGKEHTYHYSYDVEQAVIDKIAELLALRLIGIEIELIGTWIWISGDTKPNKEALKEIGCVWHSKRKRWYWHGKTYRRKYSGVDFEHLRRMYGSRTFETDDSTGTMVAA